MDDYRGVHAFRVALSPVWPYEQFHIPSGRLVYLNTNRPIGASLSVRVPRAKDPRPVDLLLFPGPAVSTAELGGAPVITADWMGF